MNSGRRRLLWIGPICLYTASWQVIEERENGSSDPSNHYVWSPVYVNALILRDADADASSGGDLGISGSHPRTTPLRPAGRQLQRDGDPRVQHASSSSWTVAERFLYDPYGEASIRNADYSQKGTGLVTASGYNWAHPLPEGGKYDPRHRPLHFPTPRLQTRR